MMNEEQNAGAGGVLPPATSPASPSPTGPAGPPPLPETLLAAAPPVPRWRWWIHLGILSSYLGILALLGTRSAGGPDTRLPSSIRELLLGSTLQIGVFAAAFALAIVASRADRDALRLRWRGGPLPLLLGVGYSVGLRLGVGIITAVVLGIIAIVGGLTPGELASFRPKVENLVDVGQLMSNPWYMLTMTTWVSFVLAGLTEELWRSGMLAALQRLFPGWSGRGWRQYFAVIPVAIVFGLGHTAQGWSGMAMTFLLGLGLGAIMIAHRSIWPAVIAHGCFNATSFLLLPIAAKFLPELLK